MKSSPRPNPCTEIHPLPPRQHRFALVPLYGEVGGRAVARQRLEPHERAVAFDDHRAGGAGPGVGGEEDVPRRARRRGGGDGHLRRLQVRAQSELLHFGARAGVGGGGGRGDVVDQLDAKLVEQGALPPDRARGARAPSRAPLRRTVFAAESSRRPPRNRARKRPRWVPLRWPTTENVLKLAYRYTKKTDLGPRRGVPAACERRDRHGALPQRRVVQCRRSARRARLMRRRRRSAAHSASPRVARRP